jgi:serine/threonine protein phosphatase PrpC
MNTIARSGAPWRIEVGFVTHPGLVRDRNEDAYTLFVPYEGEEHLTSIDGVFAVADGMGGHDAGDVASRHVVDAVISAFAPGQQAGADLPIPERMEQVVQRLHRELHDMATRQGAERGMGSTLTIAIVEGQTLHFTHVGDSRCYRFREGVLERLTEDHSWVAEQLRAGLLTEQEAESHTKRNVLTQCLGIGAPPRIRLREEVIKDGDRFLLCSDGLHALVPDDVIARVLADETPQGAAQRLAGLANERGGPDNITVVVFEVRRARVLSRTLPDGVLVVAHGAGVAVTRRQPRVATGLFAAGIVLLAAAGAAWFWLRPSDAAASRPQEGSAVTTPATGAGTAPALPPGDTMRRPPPRDTTTAGPTGAPAPAVGAPPATTPSRPPDSPSSPSFPPLSPANPEE